MKIARAFVAGAILLLPLAVQAEQKSIEGRTGFPKVWTGRDKVWIQQGAAELRVVGGNLIVEQSFRLKYPGPKLERGMHKQKVGVREDYYRSRDKGSNPVTVDEAKGFRSLSVWVDGHRVNTMTEDWRVNDKQDLATRWRTWEMTFAPGQMHRMRIVSEAPLGWDANKRFVQFMCKDEGGWRQNPDYLEVRVRMPRAAAANLAALEPHPSIFSRGILRWIYRHQHPKRDIYFLLPASYAHRANR